MFLSTLCYIQKDGATLMLHRVKKAHDLNEGKWVGIGGKFESGESPEDCLLREVKEETGLTLTSYRFRGIVTFANDTWPETEYMHLFTADDFEGGLKECDEGVLRWVPDEEIPLLPQWEGDAVFFRLIREEEPFFSLKLNYHGDALTGAVLNGNVLELEEKAAAAAGTLKSRKGGPHAPVHGHTTL